MKTYLVGGAVRNKLLGLPPKDNDYVVVGATPQQMIEAGYNQVGISFPVFIKNGCEYALARTEVSTGKGYKDFKVQFDSEVTLEQDLSRRDFTMNAIAEDSNGNLIDPYGGAEDIKNRVIRAVDPNAFEIDPVRILRLARFAAQYPSFSINPTTLEWAKSGELKYATPERVAKEMEKALMGKMPSRFFNVLRDIKQLSVWFPEVFHLIGKTQSLKWHAEGDAYTHTMMVLDSAAKHNESLIVRFGCLVHDFGKGNTPLNELPKHHGHEKRGVQLVYDLSDRLKLSSEMRYVGADCAEYHMHVHKIKELNPKTMVKLHNKIHLDSFLTIANVARHDVMGRLPYHPSDNDLFFYRKMIELSKVKLSNLMSPQDIEKSSIQKRKDAIYREQIKVAKSD